MLDVDSETDVAPGPGLSQTVAFRTGCRPASSVRIGLIKTVRPGDFIVLRLLISSPPYFFCSFPRLAGPRGAEGKE